MNEPKMKVTIEFEDKTQVIECTGLAAMTIRPAEDKGHELNKVIVGCMKVTEVMGLYKNIYEELLPELKDHIMTALVEQTED